MRSACSVCRPRAQQVEQEVGSGDPAHVLVETIERQGCDAVIMSAHGGGLRAAVMGSVSQEMVQISPVPVTLVKAPPEPTARD